MIDRLEELLDRGWRLPLSDRVAIDHEAFLNIIDQMRIVVPQEVKLAREVELEKDKYIAQAHEEARQIIAQAREDAARQLDEHEIRRTAEARAERTLELARQQAARVRAGADEFAETKLKELQQQVEKLRSLIQNGLSALQDRRPQPSEPPDASGNKAPAESPRRPATPTDTAERT